jgi:hypothetical protein
MLSVFEGMRRSVRGAAAARQGRGRGKKSHDHVSHEVGVEVHDVAT